MSTVSVETASEQGITADAVRPQRADARRNHERVLAAATAVFAERGADASVAEIARRAGVGAGTLHRHFPTKRELLLATLEGRFDELQAALAHAATIDDGWEALVYVITACAELQARDRGFLESVGPELFGEPRLQSRNSEWMRSVSLLIQRTQDAGLVRDDLVAEDLPFIISAVGGATGKCASSDVAPDLWRRYLGLVLDGMRPAAASELPVPAPSMAQLTARCQSSGS